MTEQQVERRIVTVLFADLVGFTSLSEGLDAEDVATIQDGYFAMVRETVARYGGQLEKFIGDAAMAAFGVPRARDDDAARAVRAGLALVHGIQQIGAHLGLEEGALRLRVGVNTGEVVVATGGPDVGRVTGDTVNTAARLQAAAPPSGVLIGEATALAVDEIAELAPAEALELKGKAETTQARLVVGLRAEPSREQAMGDLRAPMIGRQVQLDALLTAWRRASEERSVERVLIAAPPGVGKSRLLRELALAVERGTAGGRVLQARGRAEAVSPYEAIAGLLMAALSGAGGPSVMGAAGGAGLGITGTADERAIAGRAALENRLAEAGTSGARREAIADSVASLLWPSSAAGSGARPLDDRDALFGAWLEALDALAGGQPQAWLIEDVHWASGDVLAFLDAAVAEGAGATAEPGGAGRRRAGRLVVATSRPSLLGAQPDWCAPDDARGRHLLHLETLPAGDARTLVEALVGRALPDELVERVAQRSDGNCLFIEELLRTWVSVGTLVRHGVEWRLAVPAEEIPLPTSVQSIYAAQLDDLPPDARQVARRASVAGRRFAGGALRPLGVDDGATRSGLSALARRQLISGPLAEPLWPDVFAYRHALLRDAGYSSLARAERARLHLRLARWLEEAAGERGEEVAESVAGHYAAALESAPALAREVEEGVDREAVRRLAAGWYERAGRAAIGLAAHDSARTLLRRAIELTSEDEPLPLARRWEVLADATAHASDMDVGAAAYERAMSLYRSAAAGDPAARAEARAGLARAAAALADVWYEQLRFDEARDMAEGLLAELGDADPASIARLLIAHALASQGASGEQPGMADNLRHALALAREAGEQKVELAALSALTLLEDEGGRASPTAWQDVQTVAERVGDWATALSAVLNQAMPLLDDHAERVDEIVDRGRETALARGRTEDAGWCDYLVAEAAFVGGDWARAIEVGMRAVELGEANAYRRLTVRTWHVLVPISVARGDDGILRRAAVWYAALEGPLPESPYARVMRPAQDLWLAERGLGSVGELDAEPRIASYSEPAGGPSWTAAADRVFRHWIETGELDGASRIVAAMGEAIARQAHVSSLGQGTYELLRARLALALGDRALAGRTGSAALGHFRISNAPWWMAKAMRLLERAGSAPRELVREAAQIEKDLGLVQGRQA